MKQPLLLLLASMMLVSCSNKYGSKLEAGLAKDKWIKEGGSTKVEKPVSPMCDYKDEYIKGIVSELMVNGGLIDCSTKYTSKTNRKCIDEKETNQFVCMEMKEDGFDYTYFKY